MKKIIAIIVIVAFVSLTGVIASNHLVKVETKYSYDRGFGNWITGRTTVHMEKIETMLFSGEVIDQWSGEAEVELTGEMRVFNNSRTYTQIVFR